MFHLLDLFYFIFLMMLLNIDPFVFYKIEAKSKGFNRLGTEYFLMGSVMFVIISLQKVLNVWFSHY